MQKYRINLLQPELTPVKQTFTLGRVVGLWGIVLLGMIVWAVSLTLKQSSLSDEIASSQIAFDSNKNTLTELQTMLANRKPDPALQSELETLNKVINDKSGLQQQLTNEKHSQVVGFAQIMTELAKYHHKDIRLTRVYVNPNNIAIQGTARHAEVVPYWLSGFEHASFLSGQTFSDFSMNTDEDEGLVFNVSSTQALEGNP